MGELEPLWIRWPYARIRRELETRQGDVLRFVAQLEYDIEATPSGQHTPEWRPVARFDHNKHSEQGHDVSREGLHLDIYRDGDKYTVLTNFPPVTLHNAFAVCEEYLQRRAPTLLAEYEQWHGLDGPWRNYSSE